LNSIIDGATVKRAIILDIHVVSFFQGLGFLQNLNFLPMLTDAGTPKGKEGVVLMTVWSPMLQLLPILERVWNQPNFK